MKLGLKTGDTVEIIKGKYTGKKSKIVKIDKQRERVVLDGLKKSKVKTKKNETKELHGSFHVTSLKLFKEVKAAAPAAEEKTEAPATEEKAAS